MAQIHFVVHYDTNTNRFFIDDETLMAWKGTNSWFDPETQTWVRPDEVMENGDEFDWDIHAKLSNTLGFHNGNVLPNSLTYFAEDGNYGDASSLALVDTSEWTEDDWATLESESDWNRPETARSISAEK